MLKMDRIPLHYKTAKVLDRICDMAGIDWTERGPLSWKNGLYVDHAKARQLCREHGATYRLAATALRRNLRWHEKHPSTNGRIRYGDIPF